jgi:hypothetical protein
VRAGLITTNSITQIYQRAVVADAAKEGASVIWAVADHPWTDEADGAAVRVAMTVLARDARGASRVEVDEEGAVVRTVVARALNADLSVHADVASAAAVPLLANAGLSYRGFAPVGAGFVLGSDEADRLRALSPDHSEVIRPFVRGRDLAGRPGGTFIIDFGLRTEEEARAYPVLFDYVRDRVRPGRMAKADRGRSRLWWRFGRSNRDLRTASEGLRRYVATPYVARHRAFVFLDASIAPDDGVVAIALDASAEHGVCCSSVHVTWATASGSRLGVGNDPRYNNSRCFDSFPFPDPPKALRARIADVAERLDAHRKAALERDERVTMTGMYNVVEKLRSGAPLTKKEQAVHTVAACGVLRDLHEELDALVAEAYGWEWPQPRDIILERLVALHDERVREEKAGKVRWLRPDYQIQRFATGAAAPAPELALPAAARKAKPVPKPAWPAHAVEQITAIKDALAAEPLTAGEVAARFEGARPDLVRRHVETLVLMGEVRAEPGGRYVAAGVVA